MSVADVAIVGAGAVGCAMARRFTLEGASVVLLERSADLLSGASKGNSAILHTGFDAPPAASSFAACRPAMRNISRSARVSIYHCSRPARWWSPGPRPNAPHSTGSKRRPRRTASTMSGGSRRKKFGLTNRSCQSARSKRCWCRANTSSTRGRHFWLICSRPRHTAPKSHLPRSCFPVISTAGPGR